MPPAPPLALADGVEALGPTSIPALIVSQEDLEWFELSPEARALLAHVDGVAPLEGLSVRANLAREDCCALLLELAKQGVVSFR
jgi:hypothetical protein